MFLCIDVNGNPISPTLSCFTKLHYWITTLYLIYCGVRLICHFFRLVKFKACLLAKIRSRSLVEMSPNDCKVV